MSKEGALIGCLGSVLNVRSKGMARLTAGRESPLVRGGRAEWFCSSKTILLEGPSPLT